LRLRWGAIVGTFLILAGVLVAANGLVSGPHAFWLGWYSVVGSIASGLLFVLSGYWFTSRW
jgi:hypothetical protein